MVVNDEIIKKNWFEYIHCLFFNISNQTNFIEPGSPTKIGSISEILFFS